MSCIVADGGAAFASVRVMDAAQYRWVCRFVCYTLAMTAVLLAPAILQAVMLLRPGMLAAQHAAGAMSCLFAAAVIMVPLLLQNLVAGER
jgi:hypothetical protein